jgi:hypothetical protein
VAVSGLRNGQDWSDELPAAAKIKGAGIDKLWARKKIDSLLDSLAGGADANEVKRQVTELGLHHHLVTPHTSLVSVDVQPTAPAGVQPATRLVPVNPPRNAPFDPADLQDTQDVITVLGETPLLDERRISTGATVTQTEMDNIPAARDPWTVLQSTPGVLTDRINVGGNESSSSYYVNPGSSADQNVFSVDSLVITDRGAASYDFDAFEEMQVTTGGAEAKQPTPGVQVNMVTKRGTNEWRGSGEFVLSDEKLQARTEADRLRSLRSGGAELGGPLSKDHAWIWGTLGGTDLDRIVLDGQSETSLQTRGALKLNAQVTASDSATLLASRGDTEGSGLGAGPQRAPETTWKRDGRDATWKIENTAIFNADFYLTATAGRGEERLQDDPRQTGGEARIDGAGIAHGSWFGRAVDRRTDTAALESALFFNMGSTSHELKIAAEDRRLDNAYRLTAPGRIILDGGPLGLPAGLDAAEDWRSGAARITAETAALWAQDTLSAGNLTASLGLRFDEQDLGIGGGPSPRTLAPRRGLSWTPGSERRSVVRATHGRSPHRHRRALRPGGCAARVRRRSLPG